MKDETLFLDGSSLTADVLSDSARDARQVRLSEEGLARMAAARRLVDAAVAHGEPVYGVTTGLGARVGEALPAEALSEFSYQTLRGRAHAVGSPLPPQVVRAAMIVRLNTLLSGAAAASPAVAEHLLACLNAGLVPVVGESASVGAGDLVWNATLGLALVGEGPMSDADGRVQIGAEALRAAGIAELTLGPRDGLALANHSGFSAALAALGVAEAADAYEALQSAAALSMEGFRANLSPLDPRVLALRPQPGQAEAAEGLRLRLAGSSLERPGAARRLQDPTSFRNLAQVHGAVQAAQEFARRAADWEINGASDNPVALVDDGVIVSGGAYHTPHLTSALETLSRACTHAAMTQLGRLSKMMASRFTDLPLFLARGEAQSNGFAPVLKVAEAVAAELAQAAQPAPVWPSVSADGVEDSLTSAPVAAKALLVVADRLRKLVAIELMIAAQAVDLRGCERELSPWMARVYARVRERCPPLAEDRPLGAEIDALAEEVGAGRFGAE
ncbi:MAG: aromatic amino acid lyase [Rhodovibrionaceae bacterium]|nr:aromatic amino acid lyase [Rhodovibrionaceae bacterium]